MMIYLSWAAQIAALKWDKAPTEIPPEYADYAYVFSPYLAMELPENTGINKNVIKLIEGKQPLYGLTYSLGPVELETLKTYIKTYLKTGFIRPSKSPAGTSVLFDKKPDVSFRLCVNYRGLNNPTIKNRYSFPLIGEYLDRLGRANRFTQLDLTCAYRKMRIWEGDERKTAFWTRYGQFEYQAMSFGLSNVPNSFQEYINRIHTGKLDIFVIMYLDNILIYTEDPGQPHVKAVGWVPEQLRKLDLFVHLKKCRFHQDEVRFLGFVVSGHRMRIVEEEIEAAKTWPEPQSVRDIQVFLGFANFYRRFIKNFNRIATPLTSILRTTSESSDARSLSIRANDKSYGQEVEACGGGVDAAGRKVTHLSKDKKSKILAESKKSAKAK